MYYAINCMKSQATVSPHRLNTISLSKANNFIFSKPSSPLKILIIITQGVWGGAQRYVLDLATELSKHHQVTVAIGEITGAKNLQEKLRPYSQIQLIQLKHLQRAISPFHDILTFFELRRLYKKIKPDIVHLNSTKASIIGSLAKPLFQNHFPKIVYTVHGWIFLEPLAPFTKFFFQFLEKITAHCKDALILLSPEEKHIGIQKLHLKKSKLHIIPLGISSPPPLSQTEARKKIENITHQSYEETQWVGTIAGLYKTKGLETLLFALTTNEELKKNHYFIIGEGPERSELEKIITKNNLQKNVTLTGHINNAAELLTAFDLFVLPSKKEGLPYVLLEAMQINIPIVATTVGGVPSLLSSYPQATLVPPQSNEKLSLAILLALASSANHRQFSLSSLFSLTSMTTSTLSLYYSLLPHSKPFESY